MTKTILTVAELATKNRKKITINCQEPTLTQQHFQEECDVNRIVKRFAATGIIDHVKNSQPQYGYCPSVDFTEAAFTMAESKSRFAELPSEIRKHFGNDPLELLKAAENPERRDEFVELGLLDPIPPETEAPELEPLAAPTEPPLEVAKTPKEPQMDIT